MDRINLTEDLSFSRFVYGLWRMNDWKKTKQEILYLILECIELGITTFDLADIYGDYTCEERFGDVISKKVGLRNKIEIVTKCSVKLPSVNRPDHNLVHFDTSKEHIINSLNNSLKALKTDYVDVLLIHRPNPNMDPEQIAEAFYQLKKQGKVLEFGVSNFKRSQYDLLQSYVDLPLVTNQIELSAYELENFEDGTLDLCLEKRISPMGWSPLAGGIIYKQKSDKSIRLMHTLNKVAQEINVTSIDKVLYAWLLSHPAKIMPIIGSGKIERIQSAVKSLDIKVSNEQWFEIFQSSKGHSLL